jgi:uncharacterized protein
MQPKELIIALPTDDREKAFAFYTALGLKLARDPESIEIPEPLELRLTNDTVLMIVPRDGFAFVSPGNTVAANGISESVQSLILDDASDVDALIKKAKAAGATIVVQPSKSFMGYMGQFKDLDGHLWMAISN